MRKSSTASLRSAEWSESDGLIHFLGKVYVPPTGDLRRRIVYQHHDTRVAGHPGRFKTLELVSRNYWWPQMSRYVGAYTRHCDVCLRTKTRRRLPVGLLVPSETPSERWEEISVDLIVELPPAHGYDAIMVVTDMLSKRAHALPCHSDIDSVGVARLFYRHIWKLHGVFQAVRSDRGTQFVSEFTEELYRLLGIKMNTSTAHHPQTDGQTERVNQEVEQYLRVFCNFRQDDWDELLPSWEFTFNNSVHASTQQTPFVLDTGRNPRMGFEPRQPPSRVSEVNRFVAQMKDGLAEAKAAIVKAKDEQARYYNRRRAPAPTFVAGDFVWLDASDINQARPARKLSHRFLGPYEVVKAVGSAAYKLKLPPELSRLHDVFPVVKLEKAERDPITQRIPPPLRRLFWWTARRSGRWRPFWTSARVGTVAPPTWSNGRATRSAAGFAPKTCSTPPTPFLTSTAATRVSPGRKRSPSYASPTPHSKRSLSVTFNTTGCLVRRVVGPWRGGDVRGRSRFSDRSHAFRSSPTPFPLLSAHGLVSDVASDTRSFRKPSLPSFSYYTFVGFDSPLPSLARLVVSARWTLFPTNPGRHRPFPPCASAYAVYRPSPCEGDPHLCLLRIPLRR